MAGRKVSFEATFKKEFGSTDFAKRLWCGGLRIREGKYALKSATHVLSDSLSNGLELSSDESTTALINDIESFMDDNARLRRACSPFSKETDLLVLPHSTLIRVLLSIEPLQPPLVRCVVNKISEIGEDIKSNDGLAVLLLSQLKWLDFVADSPAMCENLFSIVPVVCPKMQCNIVESLPEILDDHVRVTAAKELTKILAENTSIIGSVVDALGALGVHPDLLEEVNGTVLSTLSAARRDILPSSLRYLLRTAPPVLYDATVYSIRAVLAQPSLGLASGRLVLDALRSGLRVNKNFADHFVKVMKRDINESAGNRPADVWIIMALFDCPGQRKSVEVLFRRKASANHFTETVFDAALAPFADSFCDLQYNLLCMAALVLRASELNARRTGICLYAMLFRLFKVGNARRNIINALLEHTGSRRTEEVDSALDALVHIARESESSRILLAHSALIHGLLDFIETFSTSQVRQIWTVLALLCRSALAKTSVPGDSSKGKDVRMKSANEDEEEEEDDDAGLFDDDNQSELATLEILLRKELTSVNEHYRRIGVIGASTMIKILGSHMRTNIFKMLLEPGVSQSSTQALAFDELSRILPRNDPVSEEAIEKISRKIMSHFEDTYIADARTHEDQSSQPGFPKSVLWANHDGPEVEVCIPIYRLVNKQGAGHSSSRDALCPMAPELRLLCVLTAMRDKGDLREIDAVIGAPLRIPEVFEVAEFMSLSAPAKRVVYISLFVAHGWIVELMNCFSEQDTPDLISKCLKRLEDLINLEEMLCLITAEFANWRTVLFDSYSFTEIVEQQDGSEKPAARAKNANSSSAEICTDWKVHARKLDPKAIGLLRITASNKYGPKDTKGGKQEKSRKGRKLEPILEPPSLLYLLEQLMRILSVNLQKDLSKLSLKGNFLSATVLQTGSSAPKKLANRKDGIVSNKSPLEFFGELKTALVSLAPQLARSLRLCGLSENGVSSSEVDQIETFKSCVILCLKCLAGFLTMSSAKDVTVRDLVFDVLASIRFDASPILLPSVPITEEDIHVAAKHAFGQLRGKLVEVSGICDEDDDVDEDDNANLDTGGKIITLGVEGYVTFLAALEALYGLCSSHGRTSVGGRLSDSAGRFLEKNWGNCFANSKRARKFLPGIVRIYIQCAEEPFELVDELRERLTKFSAHLMDPSKKSEEDSPDLADGKSNSKVAGWGSLTADTYHTYASCVFEQYLILFIGLKPAKYENTEEAFGVIQKYLEALMPLFELSRNNQLVLGAAMRAGRMIIDGFMKAWIPWLKEKFPHYKKLVMKTLKMKQKSTRLLQTFCNHSKGLQDPVLTCLVPPLKKSMEFLLFCVKGLMQSQNLANAYMIGNLKHRNLCGEVISSQEQYKSECDNSSESEYESDDEESSTPKNSASRKLKSKKELSTPAGKRKLSSLSKQRPKSKTEMSGKQSSSAKHEPKQGGSHPLTTQSDDDGNNADEENPNEDDNESDKEIDEDEPLIHSLAPHNPGAYTENKTKRKRRKTSRSKFIEYEAVEADDTEDEENDADENGNLSGFVVDDSSGDER